MVIKTWLFSPKKEKKKKHNSCPPIGAEFQNQTQPVEVVAPFLGESSHVFPVQFSGKILLTGMILTNFMHPLANKALLPQDCYFCLVFYVSPIIFYTVAHD